MRAIARKKLEPTGGLFKNGLHLYGFPCDKNNANSQALCPMVKKVTCIFGQPSQYSFNFRLVEIFVLSVTG